MKTKILHMLEIKRGEFVSGEALAESLGVTRAAVWKAVNLLRRQGHKISAVTKRGYILENFSDVLSAKGIISHLKQDTKISNVIFFDTINSTNTYAKKLALLGGKNGTLIAANHQTEGRGRHGHSFESPAGTGLYMTLIMRPTVDISRFQMITIAAAVAVCRAIEDLYPDSKGDVKIKWVNDVFFRGKKITGILTEAVTNFESGEVESVVTGIGINVSTKNFTEEVATLAGSIFTGDEKILFGRDELCAHVADYLIDFAENLNDPEIIEAYRERSLLTGENITYMKDDTQHSGLVTGIDDSGGLIIQNSNGDSETLRSGEVSLVRKV